MGLSIHIFPGMYSLNNLICILQDVVAKRGYLINQYKFQNINILTVGGGNEVVHEAASKLVLIVNCIACPTSVT